MDDQCKYNTYTCYIYNLLWFIDHPKNTLSYSINHAFHNTLFNFQYFTILNQFKYAHKFNLVMQFNSFMSFNLILPINSVMSINSTMSINSIMPINSITPLTNLTYVFDIQNISHRHGPVGLQACIKTGL